MVVRLRFVQGSVVGGNQRLKIYQEQGLKEVACSVVELRLKKEKILNLRLNNLAGTWDWDQVGNLLKELDREDWPLTGFDDLQIEPLLVDNLNLPPEADGREYDESAADGVKMATCPKCNHEFPI